MKIEICKHVVQMEKSNLGKNVSFFLLLVIINSIKLSPCEKLQCLNQATWGSWAVGKRSTPPDAGF